MKRNTRQIRVNEEVRREISNIIRNELKDPSIPEFTSVTNVEVTKDLKYAKVFISVLGKTNEQEDAILGLKRAKGYIRKEVAARLNMRNTPELLFELDNSIEYGVRMSKVISDLNPKKPEGPKEGE